MFIQTDVTPNPNAIKFFPSVVVSPDQPMHYSSIAEAKEASTLAVQLFSISKVKSVFFGSDFITITKEDEGDWLILKPEILMVIMDYFTSGFEVFDLQSSSKSSVKNLDSMSKIELEIIEIIETRVRPSVAMDGGDIIYKGFENGVVTLELRGACQGCPSSSLTLKSGIESMLKHFVPEVESVEAYSSTEE